MNLMDHQAWLALHRHDCVLFDTKSYPHCSNLANSLTQRCPKTCLGENVEQLVFLFLFYFLY